MSLEPRRLQSRDHFGLARAQPREPGLGGGAGNDREFSLGNRFHMGPLLYHIKDVMFYTPRAEKNLNLACHLRIVWPNSLRVDISLCFCISFKLEVCRFLVLAVKSGYCAVSLAAHAS